MSKANKIYRVTHFSFWHPPVHTLPLTLQEAKAMVKYGQDHQYGVTVTFVKDDPPTKHRGYGIDDRTNLGKNDLWI